MGLIIIESGHIVASAQELFKEPHDETFTRSLDVPYTNNTGRMMFVIVSVTSKANASANAEAMVYGQTPSGDFKTEFGFANSGSLTNAEIDGSITFIVPPGQTYQVFTELLNGGSVQKLKWIEFY